MNETEIKLMFPSEKLDALRYFMSKKEVTIENELKDYLDKVYEKTVPAYVREYVESRLEQNSTQEQLASNDSQVQQQPQRQPRQTRRQRAQTAEINVNAVQSQVENTPINEEENQGMNMSL
ncbi:DUF6103 family protein [Ruminiclostridium cellulolyticum]|uniref:Uncharacterized protein n=1 Tax=Ruminiclostridium cellulolyticum (strain ATCC 35319 / DSM 5812 / JCM 6584 / H10) TaxID=394503 RepID=B8I7I3_RUMCH|nr:DUF6103 family protein [Ruminiclostridium cellulolyticum]ACL77054.1 conserved hypothetical protein [Ruminiclostridium cellulolyticum H10]